MKNLRCAGLLSSLMVSACGQTNPQDQPSAPSVQVAAMVDSLYREVVARHPLSTPDRKVFGRYISRRLSQSFDADDACADAWFRRNPDPNLKPDVGMIEFGVFSGGADNTEPQAFHIEKVERGKDGFYRVPVKLTHTEASYKLTWHVVAVVVRENGRFFLDDVLYLKQVDRDESRLSDIIAQDCRRSRY